MSLAEVVNAAKYSSGYHGDGPAAATPDYGFLFNGQQQSDQRQQTALKLLQLQALVKQAQASAAVEQRKQQLWNSVGTPPVSDKSTSGDVKNIVDSEKVGGRDAGVVNDGNVAGNADTNTTAQIPSDTQSNSSLVNMMKGLQPTISQQGNLILSRPKQVKYDDAKTFDYAKRLTDKTIIQSGKERKDFSASDYTTLVNSQMPQAEQFLYGKSKSQPVDPSVTQKILSKSNSYQGVSKNYDEVRTFEYARRLADQSIIQSGKTRKDIAPEDYKTLVNDNIPTAEKYLYGRVLSQPDQSQPAPDAATTGAKTAVQTGLDLAQGKSPAPGEQSGAPQVSAYKDGQTAINPKTGKRLKFSGGQWVPIN